MLRPTFTVEERTKANEVVDKDWITQVHFWAHKYVQTTGADHMKSLVSNASHFYYRIRN